MMQKEFPTYATHGDAVCFDCAGLIGTPINYGFSRGRYGAWCDRCKWRTCYDTPDTSIQFDVKGDPINDDERTNDESKI